MRSPRDRTFLFRFVVMILALSLVAAACGDDDDDDGATGGTDTTEAGDGDDEGTRGGQAVFAAEQWPECLNPVTSCANASWMHWTTAVHVLPKAMELDENNQYVPSPVLDGEPEVSEDPFTVTFNIAEDAQWDDGTPITSRDFEYTWQAYLNTPGSLSSGEYDVIESIDTSDEKVAVVTFSEPYAAWQDRFGGGTDYILKADEDGDPAGFENELNDAYDYSGGPWILQSWSENEAVLVRNDNYWDEERVPLLDQVTFIPREDVNTEINSLLSGESQAIFPQPSPGILDQLDRGNIEHETGGGVIFEGLWFNHSAPPLDSLAVREAIGYAVDRQAIIDTIMSQIVPDAEVLNCAGWVPTVGEWCDEEDFADFTYDPDRARQILEDDGWTEGSDGIYEKDGQRLEIPWATVAGNKRREDTQQLVIEQARPAGITFSVDNSDAGELFQNRLPRLDFVMAEYAQVTSPDPSVTVIYGCDQIPSEENEFSGQNFTAWCNEEVDELTEQADRAIDQDERLDLVHQIGDLVREDVVWLPLYQLPNLIAWDADRIAGPIGDFASATNSAFVNMYDWYLVQ